MPDTIPYIYTVRAVLGLCVEGLKEIGRRTGFCTRNTLHFNTFSCDPEIAREGGAWGIRRGKGCFQLKSRLYISTFRCMFAKLTFIPTVCGVFTKLMFIPTFCGMFTKITLIPTFCHHKCPPIGLRVFPPFVAYSLKSCLFPPFVACSPKSRLFPPFAITNVLLSGFGRSITIKNRPFLNNLFVCAT